MIFIKNRMRCYMPEEEESTKASLTDENKQ